MGDSNSSTSATRVIAALAVISLLAVSGIPVAALTLANASKASGTAAAQQPSTTLLATPAGLQSRGGAPATIASESVSGIGASLLSPVTTCCVDWLAHQYGLLKAPRRPASTRTLWVEAEGAELKPPCTAS